MSTLEMTYPEQLEFLWRHGELDVPFNDGVVADRDQLLAHRSAHETGGKS